MILINVQGGNTQDQRGSAFVKVYREWDKKNEARQPTGVKPEYNQTKGQTGFMLQRWQQETMFDQPYHSLEAVKKRKNHSNDKQVGERDDKRFSLGYFDPQKNRVTVVLLCQDWHVK